MTKKEYDLARVASMQLANLLERHHMRFFSRELHEQTVEDIHAFKRQIREFISTLSHFETDLDTKFIKFFTQKELNKSDRT